MQVMIDSFSFLECCVYGREQGVFILRGVSVAARRDSRICEDTRTLPWIRIISHVPQKKKKVQRLIFPSFTKLENEQQ